MSLRLSRAPEPVPLQLNWVGPGYFATIGRPLVRGREFTSSDVSGARVAVITESLASRWFAGRDPIGERLGFDERDTTIIGVVGDARSHRLREASVPMVFLLVDQPPPPRVRFAPGTLEVRVAGSSQATMPALREALRRATRLATGFALLARLTLRFLDLLPCRGGVGHDRRARVVPASAAGHARRSGRCAQS